MRVNNKLKGLFLGMALTTLSINTYAWDSEEGDWSESTLTTTNVIYNDNSFDNRAYVPKNLVAIINIINGNGVSDYTLIDTVESTLKRPNVAPMNSTTPASWASDNVLKYFKISRIVDTTSQNGAGSTYYTYYYGPNKDYLNSIGITDNMIQNPITNATTINGIVNRYDDPTVDNIFNKKANVGGDNITNPDVWRTNLGLEDSTTTTSKIGNLVNKDASNLLGTNITKWQEKLGVMTKTEFDNLTDGKLSLDGSGLTDTEKTNLRDKLDVYSKDEQDKLVDSKLNKDGSGLTDTEKTNLRDKLDIYSKDEQDSLVDNKLNKDGSGLTDTEVSNLRDKLDVYSKDEQDSIIHSKVNKDGSNLIGDNNAGNRQSWRDKLGVETKEEFDYKYDLVKAKANELDDFEDKMRTESKIINAGIANALANAILPQPVDRQDHGLLVGVGAYAGEGALAIGYSKIFSKNVIMKLSSGIDTGKNISAGLSIGWHMEQ